jgi:hypothetical protein
MSKCLSLLLSGRLVGGDGLQRRVEEGGGDEVRDKGGLQRRVQEGGCDEVGDKGGLQRRV